MSDRKDPGSFLNRWSTRKQQSARPVVNDDAALEPGTAAADLADTAHSTALLSDGLLQGEASDNDPRPTKPTLRRTVTSGHDTELQKENLVPVEQTQALLTDADMPDVDTLTASSDISGFLGKGVSAALRKAALRHVFRQPKYNIRDGLDDYDDDYTFFEPLGDTVTSDMKFHAARKEHARLESERQAHEQAQRELDMPDSAETEQDDTSTFEKEQADKPAEEQTVPDQEAVPDDDQEIPLNKTSQATASPPCETPNE